MRKWVSVYEEHTEDSGFEHVNPNLIVNSYIEFDEDTANVILVDLEENVRTYDFTDVKQAQRFIKRLGGLE